MDREWLIEYLEQARAWLTSSVTRGRVRDRQPQMVKVIAKVLNEGYAQMYLRASMVQGWETMRDVVEQALVQLHEGAAVSRALGPPPAPSLRADALHPWVWEGCRTQWSTGHRRDAVAAAARVVNNKLQHRLDRRDVSEVDLVRQAFTLDPPTEGRPRLRVMPDDGSRTYRSVHEGIAAFGAGCYQAIRNPLAHDVDDEPSEHEALEQLAAFSILARWVESAELEVAGE